MRYALFIRFAAFLMLLSAAEFYTGCDGGDGNGASSPDLSGIKIDVLASGFSQPVHITHAGDGSGRLFVVERSGRIKIIKNGVIQQQPFLDISQKVLSAGGEQGLLSVAFPPGFASKKYFYVNYTAVAGDGDTVVARYRVTADPDTADPAAEQIILTVDQPFANHNGGQLAFGPDGFLYIGMGDGGSGGDPQNNGQNPAALLGKLLRLDVESNPSQPGYSIPASNPFANTAGTRGEIWASGLRNPWRFSFDRQTGDLFIGDVGQRSVEEIDFQSSNSTGGENYGWNIMEGSRCFLSPGCSTGGLVLPVAEYSHSAGECSVTGGMVYRGPGFASLQGVYFFGDFCSGIIRGIRRSGTNIENAALLDTGLGISTFGEDEAGNIYVADYLTGAVYKLSGT
ncbi:MAG: PQQ-dependent sugar dehydrogenase [Nitrospirae bacterium]|nr:PQQ-dependent sugar dehydrogenase [Nitrospirota bacterium]